MQVLLIFCNNIVGARCGLFVLENKASIVAALVLSSVVGQANATTSCTRSAAVDNVVEPWRKCSSNNAQQIHPSLVQKAASTGIFTSLIRTVIGSTAYKISKECWEASASAFTIPGAWSSGGSSEFERVLGVVPGIARFGCRLLLLSNWGQTVRGDYKPARSTQLE